ARKSFGFRDKYWVNARRCHVRNGRADDRSDSGPPTVCRVAAVSDTGAPTPHRQESGQVKALTPFRQPRPDVGRGRRKGYLAASSLVAHGLAKSHMKHVSKGRASWIPR